MPTEHSHFSPSKMGLLEMCPQYEGKKEVHPSATEGIMLHDVLEHDKPIEGLTEPQQKMIRWARAEVKELVESFQPEQDLKEIRIHYLDGQFGTADRLLIRGRQGVLLDYKFGYNLVDEPLQNFQVQCYVQGLLRTFRLELIETLILYPRFELVEQAVYTADDALHIESRILRTVTAVRNNEPARVAPKACEWCSKTRTCPALNALIKPVVEALSLVPESFSDDVLTKPEVASKALTAFRLLEDIIAEKKRLILEYAVQGGSVPGYNLLYVSPKRAASSALDAKAALAGEFSDAEFLSACSVSISDLEKMVAERAPHGGKQAAIAAFNMQLVEAGVISGAPVKSPQLRAVRSRKEKQTKEIEI